MFLTRWLKNYFWDVDFNNLSLEKHPRFITERILEYGDQKAINYLRDNLAKKKIKQTVIDSRFLSPKSANFWALMLGINKNKVLCLKKLSQKKQNKIWPY